MSKINTYAPVAEFKLHDVSETVSGFAAPKSGPAPCLVKLSSDDTSIVFGRASRFDALAAGRGLRQGWCGFDLSGLRQAFAIGDDVRLSCGVSGETLAQLTLAPTLFQAAPAAPQTLSVLDITRLARSGEMCVDVDDLVPFAAAHFRAFGERALVEATYQTLLRRWPDGNAAGIGDVEADSLEIAVGVYLRTMVESSEFKNLWAAEIPGPFHHAFRYDRSLLG